MRRPDPRSPGPAGPAAPRHAPAARRPPAPRCGRRAAPPRACPVSGEREARPQSPQPARRRQRRRLVRSRDPSESPTPLN
nr:MAG: hypothetical protein DIU80_00915 [Chloroflexota bacterium]